MANALDTAVFLRTGIAIIAIRGLRVLRMVLLLLRDLFVEVALFLFLRRLERVLRDLLDPLEH